MAIAKIDIAHGAATRTWLSDIAALFSFGAPRGNADLENAVSDLEHMSDRELADIGIARSEIRSAVYGVR